MNLGGEGKKLQCPSVSAELSLYFQTNSRQSGLISGILHQSFARGDLLLLKPAASFRLQKQTFNNRTTWEPLPPALSLHKQVTLIGYEGDVPSCLYSLIRSRFLQTWTQVIWIHSNQSTGVWQLSLSEEETGTTGWDGYKHTYCVSVQGLHPLKDPAFRDLVNWVSPGLQK